MKTNLCFFILLANFLDASITDIGLKFNVITEANPIMHYVYYNSLIGFYSLKFVLPCLLIWLVILMKDSYLTPYLLTSTSVIYAVILLLHVNWLVSI
jgi:hypothetical protein